MSIHDITKNDIEEILRKEFQPQAINVINDSAKHQGHAEALLHPKAGHFKVQMTSELFNGQSQVNRHRMVYKALADLMDSKIHALSLDLLGTNE